MTRIKKTRKEKSIGPAKKPLEKRADRNAPLAKKKGKGRPAGSRIQDAEKKKKTTGKGSGSSAKTADPRHGSKKPIALVVETPKTPLQPKASLKKIKPKPQPEVLTPEQELAQLENDTKLNNLLDRLDDGLSITASEQQYVDTKSARHLALLQELGMVEDDDEDEGEAWQQFDTSDLDAFKEDH